mgnify:CR=1 FL=1
MNFFKLIFFGYFLFLFSSQATSKERFICSRADTNEVVNFYVTDDKLYLSGLSISGTYSILTKYISGILALNMSNIGDESGIELIFLDLNKKYFTVKSSISNSKKNNLIEIKGSCK